MYRTTQNCIRIFPFGAYINSSGLNLARIACQMRFLELEPKSA
jgi:hypothetical protein